MEITCILIVVLIFFYCGNRDDGTLQFISFIHVGCIYLLFGFRFCLFARSRLCLSHSQRVNIVYCYSRYRAIYLWTARLANAHHQSVFGCRQLFHTSSHSSLFVRLFIYCSLWFNRDVLDNLLCADRRGRERACECALLSCFLFNCSCRFSFCSLFVSILVVVAIFTSCTNTWFLRPSSAYFATFTHFSVVDERGNQSILLHCSPTSDSMEIESSPTTITASALGFMQYILKLNDAIDCELMYRQ